jgi:hypothetical protein
MPVRSESRGRPGVIDARGALPAMDVTSVPAQTIVFGELDGSSGLGDLLALCTAMGLEVVSLRRLPGQASTRPGTPAADEARRACVVTRATHHQACPNHRISEPSWGSDQDRRRGDVCGDEARREQSNAPAWRSGEPWPPADTSVMVLGDPPGPSPHRYTRAAPGNGDGEGDGVHAAGRGHRGGWPRAAAEPVDEGGVVGETSTAAGSERGNQPAGHLDMR